MTGMNSTVCQEDHSDTRWSLGDISTQKMQYADGQLTLTYDHGTNCHNGLNRTTVFLFKCDYHAGAGEPVFITESYCFYFFSWTTKYACAPSRRTGTACRVESSSGVRYDLSELVRMENASNWVALDGESSNSNKLIFINVCGQLMPRKETSQCDSGSAICMIDKGKVVSLGKYTDPPTLNQDNSIKLLYTQGSECKKDVSGKSITTNSTITFVCQPGDLESPPVLVSRTLDGCEYQFMWKSGTELFFVLLVIKVSRPVHAQDTLPQKQVNHSTHHPLPHLNKCNSDLSQGHKVISKTSDDGKI